MAGTSRKTFAVGLAVGVVLGAGGALIIVHSGYGSLGKKTQAQRDARVLTMKPDQFPARCGRLVSDGLARSEFDQPIFGHNFPPDERKVTVAMTLPGGEKENVTAVFRNQAQRGEKPDWALDSVGGYGTDTSPIGYLKTIEELYPCTTKP